MGFKARKKKQQNPPPWIDGNDGLFLGEGFSMDTPDLDSITISLPSAPVRLTLESSNGMLCSFKTLRPVSEVILKAADVEAVEEAPEKEEPKKAEPPQRGDAPWKF